MTSILRALALALTALAVGAVSAAETGVADGRHVFAWQRPAGEATVRFEQGRATTPMPVGLSIAGRAPIGLVDTRTTVDEPGRWQGVARVSGEAEGRVILSRVRGAWHGLVMLGEGWYELTGEGPVDDGLGLRAVLIDHDAVPACGGAVESADDVPASRGGDAASRGSITEYTLLACYTSQARRAAGGRDAIIARILSGVELANTTYELSEIDVRVRLVGTLEQQAREADSTFNSTLSFFTASGNESYPDAEPARDLLGADLMTLLIDRHELCGIAWLFTGSEYRGASVCSWACVGSTGVLVHEIGHNMGCQHDRDNASSSTAPYGYGHRFTGDDGTLYRTIMAYSPGQPVARLSNPNVSFAGVATGVPIGEPGEAYNAQVVRDNIFAITQFRVGEGMDANGNFVDDAEDIASGFSRDDNGDGVPDEAQTAVLRVGSPADLTHWPDAVTSVEQALNTAESDASIVEEIRFAAGVLAASEVFTPGRRVPYLEDRVRYLGGFDPATGVRNPVGTPTVLAGDVLGNDDPGDPSSTDDNTQRIAQGFHLTEGTRLSGFHVRDVRAETDFFQGAGFFLAGDGNVRFEDCEFSSCSAESGGAAMHIENGARVTLERCVVRDTPVEGGAGVSLFDRAHLEAIDCVFENNRTGFSGGAISTFSGCTLGLHRSVFRNNTAERVGGAVLLSGEGGEITGSLFEDNHAGDAGGALYVVAGAGDSLTVRGTTIVRNTADTGGAVFLSGGPLLDVADSTFAGNGATGPGGGLYMQDNPNTPSAPSVVLHASRILGNSAGGDGGAIVSEDPGSSLSLASSVVAFNVSDADGGAIRMPTGASMSIDASTVYGNSARAVGGVLAPGAVNAQLTNSVYWNNSDDGPSVRDANLTASVSGFSIVSHNDVQDDGPGDGSVYPGSSNIDLPPSIIRPASPGPDAVWGTTDDDRGDWRPSPGSPVTDAGTTTWLSRDRLDLDGDGDTNEPVPFGVDGLARVAGAGLDMGAAEAAPGCGPADLAEPFGMLDMLDIAAFVDAFGAGDPAADLTGDGTFDLADIVAFVEAFTGGCGV